MPQRLTPTPLPTGHALFKLRDFYLPLAIEQKEYWIERYQTHDRYNHVYIENKIKFYTQEVKQIQAKLYYLSAA